MLFAEGSAICENFPVHSLFIEISFTPKAFNNFGVANNPVPFT